MKRFLLIIALIAFIIGTVFVLVRAGYYYVYNTFIKTNEEVVEVFADGSMNLVIEDEVIIGEAAPRIVEEQILLPIGVVRKYFDPYINWDQDEDIVTITTEDRLIRMRTNNLEIYVNNQPMTLSVPVIEDEGTVFVPIEFLQDLYEIDIEHIQENNVIIIDYRNSIREIAEPVEAGAVVRTGMSRKDPIIRKLDPDDDSGRSNLRVFKHYNNWYKVRTAWGEIGYIEKRFVAVTRVYVLEVPDMRHKRTPRLPGEDKISLVWDQVFGGRSNLDNINIPGGLDVISPTWLHLKDEYGNLENYCNTGYIQWAHDNNYDIWVLLSNNFDPDMTHQFLNSTEARDNLIRQVLAYASLYGFDGINIDFENVYLKDKQALVNFVRELTPMLKEQGLIVSMDVGVPGGSETYSLCYDLTEIGKTVDYVMLMTYDQHWATSPKAGSVAQLSWVEAKLKQTLREVPEEKLLLGLPFYVRVWKEETSADGKVKVSSEAYSMNYVKKLAGEKNAAVVWDEESGQFYAWYEENNATYKIWMEDEISINLKSSLVHKYNLAGTAAWKLMLERQEVWAVLENNLKGVDNYFEWLAQNPVAEYAYAGR